MMKLTTFITAATLMASTSLVSGGNPDEPTGMQQDVAGVCPTWPHCRDVEIVDQDLTTDLKEDSAHSEV